MKNINMDAVSRLRSSIRTATTSMVGREHIAELMILAAIAQEHLLIIGPPGTAKSAVVRRVSQTLGGKYFEYLLGRFTEPNELFGPVDFVKLREGVVETNTTGMLPEADIAFLDEVFLGSTAILNTLLGVLNERQFRRGHTKIQCPLRLCVGAANDLPDDSALAAFADRFLLHLFVSPVPDHQLELLLENGWLADKQNIQHCADLSDLDNLSAAVNEVDLSDVQGILANAVRLLRKASIELSDRRIVKSQRLIAAAAVLAGRKKASDQDLWPIIYLIPTNEAQTLARDVLQEILAKSVAPFMHSAAEEVTQQAISRIPRLIEEAVNCLALSNQPELFKPLAESLLREIDASFSADDLTPELSKYRTSIAVLLEY
jgi:MoxR-like ATPase